MPLTQLKRILAVGLALLFAMGILAGCGQKGPLYIPASAPAAERATLPQTVFGGRSSPAPQPAAPVSAETALPSASEPVRPAHPRALPNLPETQ